MARIWSYLKGYMMYGKRTVKTKLLALRPLKLKMISYWYWGSRGTCKNSWCHHKQWRLYHSKPELAAAGGNSPYLNKKNIFFWKLENIFYCKFWSGENTESENIPDDTNNTEDADKPSIQVIPTKWYACDIYNLLGNWWKFPLIPQVNITC